MSAVRCTTCSRGCVLAKGAVGRCRARANVGGIIAPTGYGRVTSLAIDPIEKKPIARWNPGSTVLSLGGYGCNLHCTWCQNHSISQAGEHEVPWREIPPAQLVAMAEEAHARDARMVGIAYTYNEPLVCWEYVRDAGALAHDAGLANVLVTAGCVSERVVREVAPLVDAVNVDLKSFCDATYKKLGGDLTTVQTSIGVLARTPTCHVEVTTLVVPGVNDTREEMTSIASWLAELDDSIVLHVTRFFPNWRMRDRGPTPVARVYELADVAREHLPHVYVGNC
ncbi:MAG: AmmeMemoRadiSam system radical SAM enzyme [Coriobacteriales bacterium]|nr:AmmeMemoRadiSam system radical SAM enzyme [Coriobacteriales bacterium]